MTSPRASRLLPFVSGALFAGLAGAFVPPAFAASITRARITISTPASSVPSIETEITLAESSSKPTTQVALYLAKDVSILSGSLEGQPVAFAGADVPATSIRKWTLTLPLPLSNGKSRAVALQLGVRPGNPALRVTAESGLLLPGAGWFPSLAPNADTVLPHSTSLVLPAGLSGLAAGMAAAPGGPWTATSPARPFASWGAFEITKETRGSIELEVWRHPGDVAAPRALDLAVSCWNALAEELGPASGSGSLRLVAGDGPTLAGGQRTLFWNESRFAADPADPGARNLGRDVAVALASSFWNDGLAFLGEDAAWLALGIPQALADLAFISSQPADLRLEIETDLFGSRRDLLLRGLASDRALRGLIPLSPGAAEVLRTRGALVAVMTCEAFATRLHATNFFKRLRQEAQGAVTLEGVLAVLRGVAPNQHDFLPDYLATKNLPDFRIASFVPAQGTLKDRLRIEIENLGNIAGSVEVAIETPKGEFLRSARMHIPPAETRAILMKDDGRAGIIELDPRKFMLQSDISNDFATLTPAVTLAGPVIPSYPANGEYESARQVAGFSLQLDGLSISNFEGILVPYRTFHGPSGAVLLGQGAVRIAPGGAHADAWMKAMGREALAFQGSEMWVRFPLEAWPAIERQLGDLAPPSKSREIRERSFPIVEHSLPTFFCEALRAQIPPPGASLITFTSSGGEMRGFVRRPLYDGKVFVRFWDQLSGAPIWEDTR